MLRPQLKEFQDLARTAALVPVVKTVMADLLTPVSAFLGISAGEQEAFLLESVEGGERIARYTFLGVRPYMVLESRGEQVSIRRGRSVERNKGKLFDVLSKLLREHQPAALPDLPPFNCGAVGFIAYDAVRQLEKLPEEARDDLQAPDAFLMFFDRVLAFDHLRKQIHIIAVANVRDEQPKQAYERAVKDIAGLERKLARGVSRPRARPRKESYKLKETTGRSTFLKSILKAKQYIRAGDAFQIVLSRRMELEPGVPSFEIYRALRVINPSPYLYFLQTRNFQVLGSSPEMLVRVSGRKLEYRPIAGTRPRSPDLEEDRRWEHCDTYDVRAGPARVPAGGSGNRRRLSSRIGISGMSKQSQSLAAGRGNGKKLRIAVGSWHQPPAYGNGFGIGIGNANNGDEFPVANVGECFPAHQPVKLEPAAFR